LISIKSPIGARFNLWKVVVKAVLATLLRRSIPLKTGGVDCCRDEAVGTRRGDDAAVNKKNEGFLVDEGAMGRSASRSPFGAVEAGKKFPLAKR
jgi:hypothetical protein